MGMLVAVGAAFATAMVAPALWRAAGGPRTGWILAALSLLLFSYFAAQIPAVAAGDATRISVPWVPALGITLSFHLDGLSLAFALLVTGVAVAVFAHAGVYLVGHPRLGRFFAYLLVFMASMLGLVLADNAIALFVFWELTSVASYLLIGFHNEKPAARAAAWQALLVTGLGGQALLVAFLLLGSVAETFEISDWLAVDPGLREHGAYPAVLALVAAGCFAKSAQLPFHFWLPAAMQAPTPVSAYLHAATMVKAGIYLLARLLPVLGGTAAWSWTLGVAGAATVLVASHLALLQTGFKGLLAYSTVAMLGVMTMLLGIGSPLAVQATVVMVLAHGLYKGALFLGSGAVQYGSGVTDVTGAAGLARAMPRTAAAVALAALSMAGVPPLLGFLGKEVVYGATLAAPAAPLAFAAAALAGFAASAALAGAVAIRPFARARAGSDPGAAPRAEAGAAGRRGGPPARPGGRGGVGATASPDPAPAREPPASLWVPVAVLAAAGLALGVAPGWVAWNVVAPAVAAVVREPVPVELTLWHGITLGLGLSAVSVGAGAVIFSRWDRWRAALGPYRGAAWGPARLYDAGLAGTLAFARAQTRVLQNGLLRIYLLVTLATAVVLVGYALVGRAGLPPADWTGIRSYEVGVGAVIVIAAVTAILARSLLAVVVALGAVGFGVAVVFILFGAPDLAMTQFLVETLTVILFVLVFYRLPRLAGRAGGAARLRDAAVAVTAGLLMTLLVLAAVSVPHRPDAAEFFLLHAVPEAHGRNVVNMILVDFRALDTWGEVIVLGTAGVGVFALIRLVLRGGARR